MKLSLILFSLSFTSFVDAASLKEQMRQMTDEREYIAFEMTERNKDVLVEVTQRPNLVQACNAKPANKTLHKQIINPSFFSRICINDKCARPTDRVILQFPRYDNTTKPEMILLVNNAYYERAERDEIRKLWASKSESQMQKTGKSLVIFVVGRSTDLAEEAVTYGDLLQIDVDDTYRNTVYKIEAGLKWIEVYQNPEFVAKIDSDTVVHIDRLYERMQRYEGQQEGNLLACYRYTSFTPVNRDSCSPSYIPHEDYSHHSLPPYCKDHGYVMNRGTFKEIMGRLWMSTYRNVFEVEDAFITGEPTFLMKEQRNKTKITALQYNMTNTCAAWERLMDPSCHNFITGVFYY